MSGKRIGEAGPDFGHYLRSGIDAELELCWIEVDSVDGSERDFAAAGRGLVVCHPQMEDAFISRPNANPVRVELDLARIHGQVWMGPIDDAREQFLPALHPALPPRQFVGIELDRSPVPGEEYIRIVGADVSRDGFVLV